MMNTVDSDMKELCDVCHGKKIITSKAIELIQPCDRCKGHGKLFWTDRVLGSKESVAPEITYHIISNNIHYLTRQIKNQYHIVGVDVVVTIERLLHAYSDFSIMSTPSPPIGRLPVNPLVSKQKIWEE